MLGDMSVEAHAGVRGLGAQQHSQNCLLQLQMLCGFSCRSSGVVPGARLWASWINKKVIISSCLKFFFNAQRYFLPFPGEWWVRLLSVSIISGGGECYGNDWHVWLGCLMLCALYQHQPRHVRKLLLQDLSRNCFFLHLMSYRSQFEPELFLEWRIYKKVPFIIIKSGMKQLLVLKVPIEWLPCGHKRQSLGWCFSWLWTEVELKFVMDFFFFK